MNCIFLQVFDKSDIFLNPLSWSRSTAAKTFAYNCIYQPDANYSALPSIQIFSFVITVFVSYMMSKVYQRYSLEGYPLTFSGANVEIF